jgi:hypothetical protein
MKVLWLLLAVVFTILVYAIYRKFRLPKEPFIDINNNFCPHNTKEFIDTDGNLQCCMGTIDDSNRTCNGKIICSLSTEKNSCSNYVNQQITAEREKCPSNMPNYFKINNVKRCTNSTVNTAGTAVTEDKGRYCIIYDGEQDRLTNPYSCYLHKYLENLPCNKYGGNCAKMIQEGTSLIMLYDKSKPLTNIDGVNTFCYDMKHYHKIKTYNSKLPDMSELLCGE